METLLTYNQQLLISHAREEVWRCLAMNYDHLRLRGINTGNDDANAEELRNDFRNYKQTVLAAVSIDQLPPVPKFTWPNIS